MDKSTNILPGILESYCLGILPHDETQAVRKEIDADDSLKEQVAEIETNLEQYFLENAVTPPAALKDAIFADLLNIQVEEAKDLNQLPLINKYTNHNNWLSIVSPLLPEKEPLNIFIKELRNDGKISQILLWSVADYPDEVHHDEEECFVVLKGRCRCHIEQNVVELGPGDFLEIPLHHHHNVEVLEPVIAVVQRRKIA